MSLGPLAYENWKAAKGSQSAPLGATEYPLFTDARIVGDLLQEDFGPFHVINAINGAGGSARPSLLLRVDHHLREDVLPPTDRTDAERYHGGWLPDEVAALLSLCLGIRLKAGDQMRQFAPDGDPKGLPVSWGFRPDPMLPNPPGAPVVPRLGGQHRLEDARVIATLPHLLPEEALVLIRAARSYQEAMWIADVTPELTWLMLVSAVETAAQAWRAKKDPPLDRLRFGMPKLAKLLDSRDDPAFTAEVARLIADYVGATKKFCDFVLEFLPDAPESRPPPFAQHAWEPDAFRKSLKIVYDYRSRALHGGQPFPAPMCYPPMRVGDPEEHVEVPFAMGVGASFWQAEDAPIHLNTFEYLARRALLGWWHWMAEAHVNDEH